MSVLPFSEDLQVWNNAAFDDGDSEDLRQSLKSVFGNPKASFDSVSDKENHGPPLENHNTKSVNREGEGFLAENTVVGQKGFRDEKKIDEEIEQIESEISRLNSRLEALRLEKRGRVVPAKLMDQKQRDDNKRTEENPSLSAKPKVQRSLGPGEIVAAGRRGMSLGPSEILKSKQFGRQETITPLQSRRKSCFLKLQDIVEEKAVMRGKSSSLSPKPAKNQVSTRQAMTTIASKKVVKKEDAASNLIQPKKLFRDGEKSVPATNKKPLRPGRVVASRYNQASAMRKRSLPENDKDEGERCDKKRSLSIGKSSVDASEGKSLGSESRVKKRWEIPSEIVVHGSSVEEEESPDDDDKSVVIVPPNLLPSIRIGRRLMNESPRDSGAAKRVAELVGRKSFFANDDEDENEGMSTSVCQSLSYDAEE